MSEKSRFEIYGNTFYYPETQAVLMHIDVPECDELPVNITYGSRHFELKPEFHITLLSLKNVTLTDKNGKGVQRFLESFGRELHNNIVTVGDFYPRLSLCTKDKSTASIISPIEVIGLKKAVMEVRQNGPSLPLPYPHVTLYTHGDPNGVGVQSTAQYSARCKPINIPEIESVLYVPSTQ